MVARNLDAQTAKNEIEMWNLLNSKKFAVYVFAVFLVLLVASTFLPNFAVLGEKKWYELENEKPALFWLASHFSTPYLVTSALFIAASTFLFLSTVVCTITRISRWSRYRDSEFSKEKAFSFERDAFSPFSNEELQERIEQRLSSGRWRLSLERTDSAVLVSGQKGLSGFWGSVIFHLGLISCFLAGPVTALTNFHGVLTLTEDTEVLLKDGFEAATGNTSLLRSRALVRVHDFRGMFYEGKYNFDFKGMLTLREGYSRLDRPFAVNLPIDYKGHQFSLQQFGYSPHITLEKDGKTIFDYYLNLKHAEEGDYFEVPGGLRAFVMFFPDFINEGGKIRTKSMDENNPVAMLRLSGEKGELFKTLLKPGERKVFGAYRINMPDYRHWVSFSVSRELGMVFLVFGFLLVVAGLLGRFLSNERRLEFTLSPREKGTIINVKGYSRYYPAFLEEEVGKEMGEITTKP